MPLTTQVIVDGKRNSIIKVFITGIADISKGVLYDASAYTPAVTENKLREIAYQLNGFSATLYWDATIDVPLITLDQDLQEEVDYFRYGGGLVNNGGAGRTGDILITTKGLVAGKEGYIILYINKR